MRLADKLLLCAAVLYGAERVAAILIMGMGMSSFITYWEDNIFMYIFLALAAVEYIKLLIAWDRKRKEKRAPKPNRSQRARKQFRARFSVPGQGGTSRFWGGFRRDRGGKLRDRGPGCVRSAAGSLHTPGKPGSSTRHSLTPLL